VKKQPDLKILKRGFSLVELSIVLVIIGLLVGSIMGFRSYVKTAQLTTMMNETKVYATAFSQFQTRYNNPPGDYPTASSNWTGAGNGDGNGIVYGNGTPGNAAEYYYVWQHLALAGFIKGAYTGAANAAGGPTLGVNVPASVMDNGGYLITHPNEMDGVVTGGAGGLDSMYFDGTYGHVIRVAEVDGAVSATMKNPLLTAKQAYQIDSKYDDGMPGTGNIVAPINTLLPNCASSNVAASAGYSSTVYVS
jgi:prepilin-type N-terminal cleavage/methylation domain-containing protein